MSSWHVMGTPEETEVRTIGLDLLLIILTSLTHIGYTRWPFV